MCNSGKHLRSHWGAAPALLGLFAWLLLVESADAQDSFAGGSLDAGAWLDGAPAGGPVERDPEPATGDAEVDAGTADDAGTPASPSQPSIPAALAPAPSARPDEAAIDVTVRAPNDRQRLQQSADAVTVIDTKVAKQRTADLGEVLARVQGVTLRRTSGLGSQTSFALNGLYDDQVRFFLNGVPLELAGYPFGVANVPVNLIETIEIYRGVVPIRLGADALGGVVNMTTSQERATSAAASYQVGSFGTHRLTLDARYAHEPSGFVAQASGFFDKSRNDYKVDASVSDAQGRVRIAEVRRRHDAYLAGGASLEVGFVDRAWARKLLLRGYVSSFAKQLQSNLVMTVPYGAVHYGELVGGTTLTYEQPLTRTLELTLVANYAHRNIDFVDDSSYVYDWYGHPGLRRQRAGEVNGTPSDQTLSQQSGFGRALLSWALAPRHALRASLTPTYVARSGVQRVMQTTPDASLAPSSLTTLVAGAEYELNAWCRPSNGADGGRGCRLQNVTFAKSYVYHVEGKELYVSNNANVLRERAQRSKSFGGGDSLRLLFSRGFYAKASYEYATRLPRPDEVLGNGVLVRPNLALKPEVSHNVNLGPHYEAHRSRIGSVTLEGNFFLRYSDRLIALFGGQQFVTYQNIYRAHTRGVEGALSWTSPGRYVTLHTNPTYLDQRNASSSGYYAMTKGDRIPYRPYFFASWGSALRFAELFHEGDALEPFYEGRWTHSFYVAWESQGDPNHKNTVPTQISHSLGITYNIRLSDLHLAATLEVQNLTNAKLYDYFGAQKPGQAWFFKLSNALD